MASPLDSVSITGKKDPRDFLGSENTQFSVNELKSMTGKGGLFDQNTNVDLGGDVDRVGSYDTFKGMGDTQAKQGISSALTGLQQQAGGVDRTMDRVESSTLKGMQSQQGSQQQALANVGAQQGLSASQTAMQGVLFNRQQEASQADVRSNLSIQRSERQQQAVRDLGNLALQASANEMQEKGMEISDSQFKIQMQQREDELNQNRKIAEEQLKSDNLDQRLGAIKTLVDIEKIATDFDLQYENMNLMKDEMNLQLAQMKEQADQFDQTIGFDKEKWLTQKKEMEAGIDYVNKQIDTMKNNLYTQSITNLDPSDPDFIENADNAFVSAYGYESVEDMESKADAGDEQAQSDLALYNSKDYDTKITEAFVAKSQQADIDFGLGMESSAMEDLTGADGYELFGDDGLMKDEALVESASQNFWYTKGGLVEDGQGGYYDSYEDFVSDVKSGNTTYDFQSFTNRQAEGYFESVEKKDFQRKTVEILSDETLSEQEKQEAIDTLKSQYEGDITQNEHVETYYDSQGNEIKVRIDETTGKIIHIDGDYDIDEAGNIVGGVQVNGETIVPVDGFYNLSVATDDLGNYYELTDEGSEKAPDDYFENLEYSFYKKDSGELGVKLKSNETGRVYDDGGNTWVKVKDIKTLPGYEDAKVSLKASDPSFSDDDNGLKKTEAGTTFSEDGFEGENLGANYDYYVEGADTTSVINQLKAGNTTLIDTLQTELENGKTLDGRVVDYLYEKDPTFITENAISYTGENRSTGRGRDDKGRSTLNLNVEPGGVFEFEGKHYILLENPSSWDTTAWHPGFMKFDYDVEGQKAKIRELGSMNKTYIYTNVGHGQNNDLEIGDYNSAKGTLGDPGRD